ncbi:putative VIER F-box protein 1, partial [Blomia tropicalis]
EVIKNHTTTTIMECRLDRDCLIMIFEYLSMPEKLKCRLVSHEWSIAVDKLIAGQQYLEVFAANSSLVAASVEATGISSYSSNQLSFNSAVRSAKKLWSSVNAKLMAQPEANDVEVAVANNNRPIMNVMNNPIINPIIREHRSNEYELMNVCSPSNLLNLSSYYWTYAFCASSSLFSSYSFANSTITSHEYFHSFCDCYPRQRHKYSVILDRKNISFETFNNLLSKFSNILSLVVRNVDQLSDVILFMITQQCPNVQSLSFCNCSGLKKDKNNQYAPLNCLTDYGWRLLSNSYPNLTSLTLRQCKLSESQLTKVIQHCKNLQFLDISDNICVGRSVRYLGPSIECLICGDLSNDEGIDTILSNIAFANGRHVKYLSIFGALGSLKTFSEFDRLSKLELHYYTDEELPNYLSDIGMLSLTSLVLEQIRCYESPSAINVTQFDQMLARSPNLRRLQITGDFDWNLRLNDNSLKKLTTLCPKLQEITLNGNGSLTDYGIMHLANLPLVQLSLSSFHAITDYSIKSIMRKVSTLKQITLVDMPQITERVVSKAIAVCANDERRRLNLTLSDEQMSKRVRRLHLVPFIHQVQLQPIRNDPLTKHSDPAGTTTILFGFLISSVRKFLLSSVAK